ncbi:MAG: serine protease [candidate division KSB1 bacterium]|nr:serine protease [candidate division KSB1 bacterium]MDZ7351478.1 serine protease [candidate division KSB1 bacterium]MDZ7355829.1 serine protease [candidate division KSB1 bacterium]MDZ7384459.1 serine protease [candidate division KSB1 bacterium]MDZ7398482.1 serine protease [candidate division KSB1 bacterium]
MLMRFQFSGVSRCFARLTGVAIACTLLLPPPLAAQQESVVLVHAGKVSGYGVAYGKPGNIVTALHVVAGRSPITVVWKNQKLPATIEKTYAPADLALLRLQASPPPNIPILQIYPGDAPLDTPLNFWEAPDKTSRMDKKETKLDRVIALERLDNRLAQQPAALAAALCSNGGGNYPTLKTSVFKFEEKNIKKAHSGSPLTYQGHLVGMVDGGPPVNGKGFIWAIPAAGNFTKLVSQGLTAVPASPCTSDRLYSGLRADNPHLENDPALRELADSSPFHVVDDNGNPLAFALEYRASWRDIYDTLFEEEQVYLRDLVQQHEEPFAEDERATLDDLFAHLIEVYQEDNTGATIALPAESDLSIEKSEGHTLIEASSPVAGITMIIFARSNNSLEESRAALAWFEDYVLSDREDWQAVPGEPDDIDDFLDDADEPYYSKLIERVARDDNGDYTAEFLASLTIDDTDFLGVVVKVNDWAAVNDDKDERIFLYLMEACAILTDFAYY